MSGTESGTVYDVAIIGGGPGGLAVAYALQRAVQGIRVKVFEKASKYEPCGAGVNLDANGLKAAEAISPELLQEFYDVGVWPTVVHQIDHTGKLVSTTTRDQQTTLQRWGKKGVVLGWYEIQQAIFARLLPDTVVFGQRFVDYTEDADGVTLRFDSSAGEQRASVVVGADGYFSAVREQCLGDGPPTFAETVMWRGRISWRDSILEPDSSKLYFGGERIGLLYPINSGRIVWTVSAPAKLVAEAGVEFSERNSRTNASQGLQTKGPTGEEALERCRKVFADYAPDLVEVLATADASSVVEHGIYTRSADQIQAAGLGKGRVTLVGDAAHAFRPTGQGLNTSLEDAAELAYYMQQQGTMPAALRAYESARLPRMVRLAETTSNQGASSYKKSADKALIAASAEEYEEFLYGRNYTPLHPPSNVSSKDLDA